MTLIKSQETEFHSKAPKDCYNFVYFIIFFLGLSGHLPWNAILTAQPYFKARLADSSLGTEFTAHFAIIFKALKFSVFTAVSIAGLKMNNKLLVGASAMGNVLVFSILAAMVQSNSKNLDPNNFYLITLGLVIAAGSFLALFECGMYSILGTFPSHLMQSFMAGNAIGGILAALNLIITYYSASSDIYSSTKSYFIISTIFFLISAISFVVFLCTDYCKFYQKRLALYSVISQVNPVIPNSSRRFDRSHSESFEPFDQPTQHHPLYQSQQLQKSKVNISSGIFSESTELIYKLWSPNIALFMVGFVNLTIFPALVSVTESTGANKSNASAFEKDLFVPLAFLVVSVSDFIGKMLPSIEIIRKMDNLPFTAMSVSRLFFIPLMLLGNIRINGKELIFPSILASDGIFFALLFVAFLSAAYIATVVMVSVPKRLDITEQSRGTVLLCSALQMGVFGGSVFSLCLKLILRSFTK